MLFPLNLPSRLSEEEEKCLFLWKNLGHCFTDLQKPTSINHKTATQSLLNSILSVINTAALNYYLKEDKKLFQHGSTEVLLAHLAKGGLQAGGWTASLRGSAHGLFALQVTARCTLPSPNTQSPAPQYPTLTKGFPIWHPIQNPNLLFAPDTGPDLICQFSPSLESFKPTLSSYTGHRLDEQRSYSRTAVGSTRSRFQAPTKAALTLAFPPLSPLPGQGTENFTEGSWV